MDRRSMIPSDGENDRCCEALHIAGLHAPAGRPVDPPDRRLIRAFTPRPVVF